jgi:hypothetical protein
MYDLDIVTLGQGLLDIKPKLVREAAQRVKNYQRIMEEYRRRVGDTLDADKETGV